MSYAGNPLVILFGVLMLHSGSAENGKDFHVFRLKNRFIADYEGFLLIGKRLRHVQVQFHLERTG